MGWHNGLVIWIAVIVALLIAGYGLHRLALAAERRGWIYYKNRRAPGGLGLSLIGQIYQPSIEHVVDEQQSKRIAGEQDDSGDKRRPESPPREPS